MYIHITCTIAAFYTENGSIIENIFIQAYFCSYWQNFRKFFAQYSGNKSVQLCFTHTCSLKDEFAFCMLIYSDCTASAGDNFVYLEQ